MSSEDKIGQITRLIDEYSQETGHVVEIKITNPHAQKAQGYEIEEDETVGCSCPRLDRLLSDLEKIEEAYDSAIANGLRPGITFLEIIGIILGRHAPYKPEYTKADAICRINQWIAWWKAFHGNKSSCKRAIKEIRDILGRTEQ